MTPKDFVKAFYPHAKRTQDQTGIDASFILAQAALESGWGEKAPGNMFFGVKATATIPENRRQLLQTTEYFVDEKQGYRFPEVISIRKEGKRFKYTVRDWFRKYNTPEECFTDHANLLLNSARYSKAIAVKDDPRKMADEVAKAGYATDPNYASKIKTIIGMIEKNI